MKKVPSYVVTDHSEISSETIARLASVLEKGLSFEFYGEDRTNLVRASTAEFSVAYSPVGDVAYILQVTLRK